ncbi:MAG: SDR family oxidoreductase [Methyloversatilis sp.]|jgi:short-subunit dehydrogenase|nr:SDR family oxidoreductase [Methyloversatilis sp.]
MTTGARAAPVVFLTGGSTGIGEALARHYAAQGATLGLVARRATLLEKVTASLPGQHIHYAADVRDTDALRTAAEDFIARVGVPDIVIGNAGVSVGTLTGEQEDLPAFEAVFDINVLGLVRTFAPFVKPMQARGSGTLVGVASVAGIRGLPGAGAYSASKAAAISYLESLRVELRGSGVRVKTLCPGYIDTPMTEKNPYPMPFMLEAADAAERFGRFIDGPRSYAVIPWQMGIVAKVMRLLPNAVYDALAAKSGRKPRGTL